MKNKNQMIFAGATVSWKTGVSREYGTLVDFYPLANDGIFALILDAADKFLYLDAGELTLENEEGE